MRIPNEVFFPEIERILNEGSTVTLLTKGRSMLPFIVGGRDCVLLEGIGRIRTGEIVLAHLTDGSYLLHRIYRIDGDEIRLMGDGNLQATECCRKEQLVGQVIEIIRNGRHIRCHSRQERIKEWMWRKLLPLRRYLLAAYRCWKRLRTPYKKTDE